MPGWIIAILLIAILSVIVYRTRVYEIKITRQNIAIREENKAAQAALNKTRDELDTRNKELDGIYQAISTASADLTQLNSSLEQTTEEYKRIAAERAQKFHEERMKELDAEHAAATASLQEQTRQEIEDYKYMRAKVLDVQKQIEDLQAKQLAYIQMKQREEEMKTRQDYYRLVLSEEDKQDVKFLREAQIHLIHKEAIDKIIWDGYYKPAYDALVSRIFSTVGDKRCGIYRITCLTTEKSYIGQSVDIRERFKQHIKTALAHTSTTNKLYQEMKQQGIENFIFEVVEEVDRAQLNEREVYWIDFYKTKDYGLNTQKGGS